MDQNEKPYLDLLNNVLFNGTFRDDRTGTGVYSLFSPPDLVFNVSQFFPLLTTKKMSLRLIFEELMFFIRGQTDGDVLLNKNVNIWSGNGSREYLNSVGLLNYRENDLGPVYGFQWRHYGADYNTCDDDYSLKGYDQLYEVIRLILYDPFSRRILMTAWNPNDLKKMALPPCHLMVQFYVDDILSPKPKLSLKIYQRSCDVGLGVPFNIASYALFLNLLCSVLGMTPNNIILGLGDAHVYSNHIDDLRLQAMRYPRPLPSLIVEAENIPFKYELYASAALEDRNSVIKTCLSVLENFEYSNLRLIDYAPYPPLLMKMAL